MRFPITVLLLLGTALAAPIQDATRAITTSKDDSLLTRGLVPLIDRALIPLKPKPVVKPRPGSSPSEPPPPIHPGGPDTTVPGGETEPQPLKPNPGEPDTPNRVPDETLPGGQPQKPNPPRLGVDGCLRKRCVGTAKDGSNPTKKVDERYDRSLDEMPEDDVMLATNKDYLKDAGLFDAKALKDDAVEIPKWDVSKIKNNKATIDKFETEKWPTMREDLKTKGWTDKKLDELLDQIKNPRRDSIVETMASPSQGAIVVKQSWNRDFDLNRPYQQKDTAGNVEWERPAVDSNQEVRWSDMVMDNWFISAKKAGVEPNTLRHIGRDNVVTEKTTKTFETYLKGKNNVVIKKGEPGFEELSNTMHTKPVNHMLADYPELGPLQVTEFKIYKTPADIGKPTYDLMIEVAPPS
jgi:hypothetical protein